MRQQAGQKSKYVVSKLGQDTELTLRYIMYRQMSTAIQTKATNSSLPTMMNANQKLPQDSPAMENYRIQLNLLTTCMKKIEKRQNWQVSCNFLF